SDGWQVLCFFFQAEDGIRDRNVTGVQTCALPISSPVQKAAMSAARPSHSSSHSRRASLSTEADRGGGDSRHSTHRDRMVGSSWEIGRASCRERGEGGGGARGGREKRSARRGDVVV